MHLGEKLRVSLWNNSDDASGNRERQAFLYDSRRVSRLREVGRVAIPPSQLPKIAASRQRIAATGRDILLEVDGGINEATAKQAIAAGADTLVAGNAVFGSHGGKGADYAGAIARLRG